MRPSEILVRIESAIAPRWAIKRERARIALDLLKRAYEGAAVGRRTQGWKKSAADANATIGNSLAPLRMVARSLVENNAFAESALSTIADHAVGWGIVPMKQPEIWKQWAETTACDADGRNDFYGLQKLVTRTTVESGECLIRRRTRRLEDGFALPMQLQVLEPDYIDTSKDGITTETGSRIIQGVQFDGIGRRIGYWLFKDHPGSLSGGSLESQFVPAESVLHTYRVMRPGQVRGVSWFAPVVVTFKDFDDYDDATLMKQKIAACLAVITSDVDGAGSPLGIGETDSQIDSLEPGMILNVPPGRTVETVQPPSVRDYEPYSKTQLRKIATGLGVTYEDLTGDYTSLPFSAARMSRLRHQARVENWRWNMIVPQLLDPVWGWFVQTAGIMGIAVPATTGWNAPPLPFIDPAAEGKAIRDNVRSGVESLKQVIQGRGENYEDHLDDVADGFKQLDKRGLLLDIDPRNFSQQGQRQPPAPDSSQPSAPPAEDEET